LTKDPERRDPKLYLNEIVDYIDDIKDITSRVNIRNVPPTQNKHARTERRLARYR
jgi:hypothetical protein